MRGRERRCTVEGGRTWEEKNEKGRTVIFHQKRIDVGDLPLTDHVRTPAALASLPDAGVMP